MKNWIKEIGNKVIINAIGTLLIALVTFIFPVTRNFIIKFWEPVLISFLLIILIYIIFYILNQIKKNSLDIISLKSTFYDKIINNKSPQGSSSSDLEKINKKLSNIESDLYELKRSDLYKKAEDYKKSGKRGALLCRLDIIELDIKRGFEFNLEESLEELFRYVKNETGFLTQDLSDVKNCLNKISNDGHKEVVDQILSQIKSKI